MSAAPTTILLELDLALNEFLIFARPIVDATALLAGQFYELILGHSAEHYTKYLLDCKIPIKRGREPVPF